MECKRILPEELEAEIVGEDYHVFPGTTLTVCALKLRNGMAITGESACISAGNFNAEMGRKIARDNAKNKLWQLLGFRALDKIAGI